jgi:tetratricopeptide (TPR) repeat protein
MAAQVSRRPWAGVIGIALIVGTGCATPTRLAWTADAIRQEVRRRAVDVPVEEIVVPFEVQPSQVARAREAVRGESDPARRVQRLVRALPDPAQFALRYQWAVSAGAEETLARGRGNCFSLSSVLVGLARGLGLSAYYLEVQVADPQWRETGGVSIHADHIAAVVLTSEGPQYVDFSGRLAQAHRVRVIGDLEALAHFHNNRGYESLYLAEQSGQRLPWEEALRSFELATRIDPALARAWNNLGVARARLGDRDGAVDAYRTAVTLDADSQSAHLNLAVVHLREGDLASADRHIREAERIDPRNPQLHTLRGELTQRRDGSRGG